MLYCNVEQIALKYISICGTVPVKKRQIQLIRRSDGYYQSSISTSYFCNVALFSFLPREIVQEDNDYIMPSTELF